MDSKFVYCEENKTKAKVNIRLFSEPYYEKKLPILQLCKRLVFGKGRQ